ncbi:MAG: hypothetical protein GXC76_16390 [Rhodanobacteraceae bacterium]|jgi:hypothetical protein|nr:hypothetical protein [Rhodanobacteraceae bacterium]
MRVRFLGLFLSLSMLATDALAAPADATVVNARTPDELAAVRAEVVEEMADGGHYEFISKPHREQVEHLFDDMQALLGRKGSVEALSDDERLKLFNLQEQLNGVLTNSDSRRVVCERAAPTGSLIAVKTCRTYGEIERQRREKDRYLDEMKRQHPQTKRGN